MSLNSTARRVSTRRPNSTRKNYGPSTRPVTTPTREMVNSGVRREQDELRNLVIEAQQGSSDAFGQLMSRTNRLVARLAYSIVGRELIDDARQESYLWCFASSTN